MSTTEPSEAAVIGRQSESRAKACFRMTEQGEPSKGLIPFITYTVGEEIANSILHGIGTLGAIAGLVLLTLRTRAESVTDITAVTIYTAAMIGMFLVSTTYHAIQHQAAKPILRVMDHAMIYLFIAGTYTPFCLSALKGGWGWSILGVEWLMAALGVTLSVIGNKALKKIEIAAYVIMGWAILAGLVPLVRAISTLSLILLFSGGVVYTLGTIWYRKKNVKGAHAVWHTFVLLGALCQWFSIWFIY